MSVALHHGDCLEVMRGMAEASVDAVVTDPPAGIAFMNSSWDGNKGGRDQWVAWMAEVAAECLRVCKPGAHALVWALPRTSHWTATAWENAGWEVRDRVAFLFGTGFPKSHDIGKAIDRAAGAEREVVGRRMPPPDSDFWRKGFDVADIARHAGSDTGGYGGGIKAGLGSPITAPATDAARQWDGWGTALKPAVEDWWLLRRPLTGTVAANVAAHGTGALNIDGCRVETSDDTERPSGYINYAGGKEKLAGNSGGHSLGRWPANLAHDGSDEVLEAFAAFGESKSSDRPRHNGAFKSVAKGAETARTSHGHADTGTAARFFFSAKASPNERRLDGSQIIIDIDRSQVGDGRAWRAASTTQEVRSVRLLVDTAIYPPRVTGVFGAQSNDASEWNTLLFGKMPMGLSRPDTKFTTATETSSTTHSAILSWLTRLLTSDSTAGASLETAFGLSRAEHAELSDLYRTTTSEKTASPLNASHALSLGPFKISVDDARSWHPTVKPIALMRWLCRLVTPPGGTVLDPFAGSGSTLIAADREGFNAIGIEREAEYVEIARRRLADDAPLFAEVA